MKHCAFGISGVSYTADAVRKILISDITDTAFDVSSVSETVLIQLQCCRETMPDLSEIGQHQRAPRHCRCSYKNHLKISDVLKTADDVVSQTRQVPRQQCLTRL
jgi:hypothetical protein